MPAAPQSDLRIAIDTGGTFTDCVWVQGGELKTLKVFSTPDDPSRAIAQALGKIGEAMGDSGSARPLTLLHGTTVGTNALLQRKGARVAIVTTAGFEDVIEIGRQARPKLYDFFFDRVEPLVSRELRFGVKERMDSAGRILEAPSQAELTRLCEAVRRANPEAIAICFLFSFANPRHESAVASVLENLGKPLSVSHRILPEFREFERTSTIVVNAYLQPLMQSYMENLSERTVTARSVSTSARNRRQSRPRIFVMQSSGGITALESAAREPVRTVLSGPAGGLVGAAAMAGRSGFEKIISFDMGGTSTDVALVQGAVHTSAQSEVAGLPIGVPMLDIHTVGAGGGSLARFDAGGALRVGPESAGADPGPICYGRGTEPTVTDANLLMGRLRPDRFLGGEFALDLERTRRITSEWLKKRRSLLSLEKFSAGVVRVVNANMERALRVVSIERGYDPREFALVAFGGAGGLHSCELAEALAIPTVIIPARPGALSAFGILASDVVKDYSRTVLWRIAKQVPGTRLQQEFRKLEAQAQKEFRAEEWRGALIFERSLDLRYRGQGYEINIGAKGDMAVAFHKEHQRRYGYHHATREIELVTLRLRARMQTPQLKFGQKFGQKLADQVMPRKTAKRISPVERVSVVFQSKAAATPVFERADLVPDQTMRGPAVITEYSATTVIPPKKKFWVDRPGNLLIKIN
ncbi:MAG TPA: hydantoinase/oxoprolinase family protein [Terriglobales bacterium]|nr:hydantoinase/oxoprolinase family protein [Terriglobales bacterium]